MNELEGCCEGTVCSGYSSGLRVCKSASAEEIERHHECDKVARTPFELKPAAEIQQARVMTSVGTFEFDEVSSPYTKTGPGGCLTDARMTLRLKQQPLCNLELHASVVSGRLEVTGVFAFLQQCPGIRRSSVQAGHSELARFLKRSRSTSPSRDSPATGVAG